MVRKLVLAVAAASALMSSNVAQALGVGDINLRSALNQPLDAEIELLQVRDLSSQEILPALASPDEFGRAGIQRDFFLTDLVFTPVVRSDGRAVIRVTSSRPVKEPYLNFLMEVRWPSGRVLREFTLLLDPPLYSPAPVTAAAPAVAPASSASTPAQRPVPSVAPGQPRRPQTQPPATVAAAQPGRPSASQVSGEWRTGRTDTLWEIAMRSRPPGASVHQTMLAIQALNPNAFIDDNINRLRADQTLRLPDADQAGSLSQAEAVAEVAAQNSAWRAGRQAAPAQRQLDARQQAAAPAAPDTAPANDALRLVAGSAEQGDGSSERADTDVASRLRDQLDETKEQLDSLEREKAEADSRLADMQAQMETLQRLLELKDAQLAAMQQQLGDPAEVSELESEPAEPATPVLTQEQEQGAELPVIDESGLPAEEMDAPADSLAQMPLGTETPVQQDESPADDGAAQEAGSAVAEPVPAAQTPAPAVAEQSVAEQGGVEALLQRMMQNQTFLMVGGGVVLLLLLLLLMALARRNSRREADMADNFIARAAENKGHDSPEDDDAFNVALAGFEDEQSQQELGINQDPITEADALIAYGKLAEAAEVLDVAITADPQRTDLRLKRMEVDGLLDDGQDYAEQVTALRNMGASEPQIAAMNMRFPAMAAALAGGVVIADAHATEDPLLDSSTADVQDAEADDLDVIDFDLDSLELDDAAAPDAAPLPTEVEEDLDLDFDLDDSLAKDLADPGATPAASLDAGDEFDLDFNLEELAPAVQPSSDLDSDSSFSLDEDFDLSLTDDLEADALMAEMDAMAPSDSVDPADKAENALEISDEELRRFEQQLDAAEEADADFVTTETPGLDTPADSEELEGFELDDMEEQESAPSSTAEQALADSIAEEDEDEFDFLSGTDECATKLDLARAYIDMGDQEGARDILGEVLDEGNDQQKQDAREMMGQLD